MSPIRFSLIAAATITGTVVLAEGHTDLPREVSARLNHMGLYGFNLGTLGGMARGNIEYDAAAASAAASNLHAMAMIDQSAYWTEGTSTADLSEGTRALPAIWEDTAGFEEAKADMVTAAAAMQEVAGDGLEAVQANMEALGGACGACHEDYRQPE